MAYREFVRDGRSQCIIPLYSLAPYATASRFTSTSIEMILRICEDPRYQNKDMILYGESAGGWACWRTLLALTEVAAGKMTLGVSTAQMEQWGLDRIRRARQRITKIITVGAMVEVTMDHPDDIRAASEVIVAFRSSPLTITDQQYCSQDPFLSQAALRAATRTWCYGPQNAFPDFDFKLPTSSASLGESSGVVNVPLSEPCFSPGNGTAILQEYQDTCPIQYRPPILQVFQTVGTRDMLYPVNVRLHEALRRLRKDVVQTEFHLVCPLSGHSIDHIALTPVIQCYLYIVPRYDTPIQYHNVHQ
jgi:acetyl esterase/lipase